MPVTSFSRDRQHVRNHISSNFFCVYIHLIFLLFVTHTICRAPPKGQAVGDSQVYRVPPYYYLHVLDQSTNVTRLEIGPITFVRKDNEQVNIDKFSSLKLKRKKSLGALGP